ncbi:MAG TPA: hypothetical protein VES02_13910 [Dermatophilaceae bacterium]|nr:hypothetical protein [Dermatophilaceae bacterium]
MKTNKRLIAPATMLFGSMVAAVAFAMPASAADPVYPPPAGAEVLGTSASTSAGTSAGTNAAAGASTTTTTGGLAFTGGAVAGIGALGGLLLVGGTTMVVASKRRRTNT